MPISTPYEESPTATLPVPCPTQPVAGRTVDLDDSSVFDWTPVPDAAHYRVQVSDTDTFESIHYDEVTGRRVLIPLGSVLPDDTALAYWRVRAETDAARSSPWSDAAHVTLPSMEDEEILRVDAPPVPLHPTEDTPADRQAVPFSWEGVPEASGYQIQVAPTEDFTDPAVDLTLDQTTSVTLCDMLSPDVSPFYWRIRTLFRGMDPGPWSTPPVSFAVTPSLEEEDDLATEASDPDSSAVAAGPVQHARTSRATSIAVSLFALLSFVAVILLIVLSS